MTDDTLPVPFVQYLRPNGRKMMTHIERPLAVANKALDILAAGFVLESEVLMTGDASFSIGDDDGDYAIEICKNGPDVLAAVDRLIMDFDIKAALIDRDASSALGEFLA
jgi:hypothetical protein